MASPKITKHWVLQNRPTGLPVLGDGKDATFRLTTVSLPELKEGQVLLRTLYIGNDPAQRAWISDMATSTMFYVPPVRIGEPMRAKGIAEVIETRTEGLLKGAMVINLVGWTEYCVREGKDCQRISNIPGVKITHHLGALAIAGLTAYYGLVEIAKVKDSDTVVVSGAAGATGGMVIQIAKRVLGCRKVVGIAGSDSKCLMVKGLGADKCLNYHSPTFAEELSNATEEYVDVFFDNVGGLILDLVLGRMNRFGRVAQCGAVAQYNKMSEPTLLHNYLEIITRRVSILGFVAYDYLHKNAEVMELFKNYVNEGKLVLTDENETVIETAFAEVPDLWLKMYSGINTGKLITMIK